MKYFKQNFPSLNCLYFNYFNKLVKEELFPVCGGNIVVVVISPSPLFPEVLKRLEERRFLTSIDVFEFGLGFQTQLLFSLLFSFSTLIFV